MLDEVKETMVWRDGIILENREKNTEGIVRANKEEKTGKEIYHS